MSKNNLIFFGNERLASAVEESGVILQKLLDAGFPISHIVVNQAPIQSRKKHIDKVLQIAAKSGIEVVDTWDESQIIALAKESKAGILAAFGRIIPERVIHAFEMGIVNIHPSLLPHYRGTTPIETALLNGDHKTGVSIMALAKGMDDGDVYAQFEHDIVHSQTKQSLYDDLSALSAEKLTEILPSILDGSLTPKSQDHEAASFTKMIQKEDGVIDWSKPAVQIEREIRAYLGWPGSKTVINGKEVILLGASVVDENGKAGTFAVVNKQLIAYCADKALKIERLKPVGKNEMDASAFLAGHSLQ
jgi:methionyl-tRNA formyltransferase